MAVKKAKPSIAGRISRYGMSRIRPAELQDASHGSIRDGGAAAMAALRPESADIDEMKAGFDGRYDDGGRERFNQMMEESDLSEEDLAGIEAIHARDFRIFIGVALAFLASAIALIIWGEGILSFAGSTVCVIFMFGSLARALQADFSGYQVRMRAFCGLRQYLSRGFLAR